MARTFSKTILLGNVGRDVERQTTTGGTFVAHASLATEKNFKVNGEWQSKTEWHRLTFWGPLAEIAGKYIRKGNRILVMGEIEYGEYENKDRVTIPTTEIVVRELTLIDKDGEHHSGDPDDARNRDRTTGDHDPHGSSGFRGGYDSNDDDLPF